MGMVPPCMPNTWEVDTGGPQLQRQPDDMMILKPV